MHTVPPMSCASNAPTSAFADFKVPKAEKVTVNTK